MNLIEKLGGYDRASKIANCKSGVVHPTKPLLDALLEYRRANNIFEVGDKVVFIHPFELGDLFTVHSICERFTGVKRNNDECIYYAEIVWGLRHATDEEIKAGHRIIHPLSPTIPPI